MKQIMKRSVAFGAGLAGIVGTASHASADTFDDTVVADKQADETRMDTWRSEVKIAEEENAKAEADYRAKVSEARGVTEKAERDAKGESERVKQENEKRKAAYEKEKREVDERNRQKRAKYHDDYRHYVEFKNRGAVEPEVPTYEPLPKLELLMDPADVDTTAGFDIARPVEKQIPHTPKLDFVKFPSELNVDPVNAYGSTVSEPVAETESPESPKPKAAPVAGDEPKGIEFETATLAPAEAALEEGTKSEDKAVVKEETKSEDRKETKVEDKSDAKSEEKSKPGEAALEEGEKTSSNIGGQGEKTSSDIGGAGEKTSSGINVNGNSEELLTVNWIDETGKPLRDPWTGSPKNVQEHGDINGYDYVTAKQDGNEVTYIFKKKAESSATSTPKEETPKTDASKSETNQSQPTSNLTEDNTAVYVTYDSGQKDQYYYNESSARANNPQNGDIVRTTEANAKSQGFSWVGKDAEPNPQKTPFDSGNQTDNANKAAAGQNLNQSDKKAEGGQLPHTGDAGSMAGIIGLGMSALSGIGLLKKKEDK